jgi:hypothetical protein
LIFRELREVNTPAMTIVNTTLPGHTFYPGTVTIQVTPMGTGSNIDITGTGTGDDPIGNDIVGYLFFGGHLIPSANWMRRGKWYSNELLMDQLG